jgi:beta-1,2-mannobiose phosphorylase / 1,2-beta-oligomannan phosphorylase
MSELRSLNCDDVLKGPMRRSDENPVLMPDACLQWEAEGAFNGCPVFDDGKVHMVYRAVSSPQSFYYGNEIKVSSIGYVNSVDGIHFKNKKQFIVPEHDWERFGCEDPRVTKLNGRFFILYTALSTYPFGADGIKIGLAITKDFKTIEAKYPVTPFNSKAMALFPGKVNGKYAAVITANTDNPPSKICLALFDREDQIWSREYWETWYSALDSHVIPLQRNQSDHIEAGAPPIKTKYGWLFIYSYIQNYFSPPPVFGIEAVLLDLKDPQKIIARTEKPLLVPQQGYELYGKVPNIVFPTGAFAKGGKFYMYYGAADTTCCLATAKLRDLLKEMLATRMQMIRLERFKGNPVISPIASHPWESRGTFNPAAIYEDDKVHILYRAMSADNTSTVGYASSRDGFTIDERMEEPIYFPRAPFEQKGVPGGNSGCEDPRITRIEDTIYMCYTAYDGVAPPRVALSTISTDDFLAKRWNWSQPELISPPGMDDKDAAFFPKKIKGKFAILHRLGFNIWIDFVDDLKFGGNKWLYGQILMSPRMRSRKDSKKIGIAGPPIETEWGWLLIYHGISQEDQRYRVKAALLDLHDPTRIIARTQGPILEPEMPYEKEGEVNNVVFPCGAVIKNEKLIVYYGGADKVMGIASMPVKELIEKLFTEGDLRQRKPKISASH